MAEKMIITSLEFGIVCLTIRYPKNHLPQTMANFPSFSPNRRRPNRCLRSLRSRRRCGRALRFGTVGVAQKPPQDLAFGKISWDIEKNGGFPCSTYQSNI